MLLDGWITFGDLGRFLIVAAWLLYLCVGGS